MKWKYFSSESYMQEHIPEPVNGVGYGGILQDVSIAFTKNIDRKEPFRMTKKDYRKRTLKTYSRFGLKIGI